MLWKLLGAVVAFVLVVYGFNWAAPEVSNVVVVVVAFVAAAVAFKYTPSDVV